MGGFGIHVGSEKKLKSTDLDSRIIVRLRVAGGLVGPFLVMIFLPSPGKPATNWDYIEPVLIVCGIWVAARFLIPWLSSRARPVLAPYHATRRVFNEYFAFTLITVVAAEGLSAIPYLYNVLRQLNGTSIKYWLFFALLLLGGVACWFKRKTQLWYGVTEMVIAALFIYDRCQQVNAIDNLPNTWGQLIGAMYFFARGVDNCWAGTEKRRSDVYTGYC